VWLLTGVWHGANWNFIAWGLAYFIILVFEKYLFRFKKTNTYMSFSYRIFTIVFVLLAWVLFRADNLSHAVNYMQSMFYLSGNTIIDGYTVFLFNENWIFLLASLLLSLDMKTMIHKVISRESRIYGAIRYIYAPILFVLMIVSVSFLVVGAHNPFIYFNF
jgi:alginate O-acetyltransferase complex protein AlgI